MAAKPNILTDEQFNRLLDRIQDKFDKADRQAWQPKGARFLLLGSVADALDEAAAKSKGGLDDKGFREHGAIIIRDVDGTVQVVNKVSGDRSSVTYNMKLQPGQRLIGFFHTHTRGPHSSTLDVKDWLINQYGSVNIVRAGNDITYLLYLQNPDKARHAFNRWEAEGGPLEHWNMAEDNALGDAFKA